MFSDRQLLLLCRKQAERYASCSNLFLCVRQNSSQNKLLQLAYHSACFLQSYCSLLTTLDPSFAFKLELSRGTCVRAPVRQVNSFGLHFSQRDTFKAFRHLQGPDYIQQHPLVSSTMIVSKPCNLCSTSRKHGLGLRCTHTCFVLC